MTKLNIILTVFLITIFCIGAYAEPLLEATKTVSPTEIPEGGTATITFDLSASGTTTIRPNLDVMITLDKSGSMSSGGKMTAAKEAAKTFVDELDSTYDQAGLVGFSRSSWNSDAYLYESLTNDFEEVKDEIDSLSAGGGTNTGDGILKSNAELISPSNVKVQILLSDGNPTFPDCGGSTPCQADRDYAIEKAEEAAANGIVIYTISLGEDANQAFMQEIANITGGDHYYSPSASELEAIFIEIAGAVNDLVASNIVVVDELPEGVDPVEPLPAGCTYDEPTRTVSCIIGLMNDGDNESVSFDVIVTDSDLTQINVSSNVDYTDYDGDANVYIIDPQPIVVITNSPPIAVDDTAVTEENSSVIINVLANDSDPGFDLLTVESATDPANGTATVNVDNTITYIPDSGFYGIDSFDYTINDGHAGTDSATVTVTVTELPNSAPTAEDDLATVAEDTATGIAVLDNDTDPENDSLTIDSVTDPAHGTTVNMTTYVQYIPDPNYNGTDSFTYTMTDGEYQDTATVTITVTPVNDAPTTAEENLTTNEDTPVTTDLEVNDIDSTGLICVLDTTPSNGTAVINDCILTYTPNTNYFGADSLIYTVTDGESIVPGTVNITINPINDAPVCNDITAGVIEDGTIGIGAVPPLSSGCSDVDGDSLEVVSVTPASNGLSGHTSQEVTYTPNANYNGADAFTYTVSDGTTTVTANVNMEIYPANDAPIAVDDYYTLPEDSASGLSVLVNDIDIDTPNIDLQITNTTTPAHGTTTILVMPDGEYYIQYVLESNYNGADQFNYTVSDGEYESTATVYIDVTSVNDAPTANDDSETVDEDVPTGIAVLGNDTDPENDSLSIVSVTDPAHGTAVNMTTYVQYTSNENYNGTDSFTYTVTDGTLTDTATVTITVNPVNDAPTTTEENLTTNEDTPKSTDLEVNDIDSTGLICVLDTTPANGIAVINDCILTYTPNTNYFGEDSLIYTVTDGEFIVPGTVNITINPINDAPVANDDSDSTDEDTDVTINVLANDYDEETTAWIDSTTNPSNGVIALNPDETITYTPNANFNGTDSFTYTVTDGTLTDTATVTITVNPVNDNPVAVDDSATVDEDNSIGIGVLANDSDVDAGDVLQISGVSTPANGTAVINGNQIDYTPNTNYNGNDDFTYTISDGHSGTATATVYVTVNPVNDNPVAIPDSFGVPEDSLSILPVVANDQDVDGDSLTLDSITTPLNGTAVINGNNVEYTPNLNYNGMDSFDYTIIDGQGGSSTATVTIEVGSENDAPICEDIHAGVIEDGTIGIGAVPPYSSGCYDPDGDELQVISVTPASNGLSGYNSHDVTYTPNTNFNGNDEFTYTVSDGTLTTTANVYMEIFPANDAPIAVDDSYTLQEDHSSGLSVLVNDIDVDTPNINLIITNATTPTHGTTTILVMPDGQYYIAYTSNTNYNGTDSFQYTVSDGEFESTATVNITITPLNDTPVCEDIHAGVIEDGTIGIGAVPPYSSGCYDPDGDELQVISVTPASNGLSGYNSHDVTYTPNTNFNGNDEFTYTVSDGSASTTANVYMEIFPANDAPWFTSTPVTSMTAGNSYYYDSDAEDIEGDSLTYSLAPETTCSWLSIDSSSGEISSGIRTLAESCNVKVIVTDESLADDVQQYTLTVNPSYADYLELTPETNTITAGETQSYTALLKDEFGNLVQDVTDSTDYAIDSEALGSWSMNDYTSSKAGTWTVTGNYQDYIDSAELIVVAGEFCNILVTPNPAIVLANAQQQFIATGYDCYGNETEIPFSLDWITNLGTMDSAYPGLFTAQSSKGTGEVCVIESQEEPEPTIMMTIEQRWCAEVIIPNQAPLLAEIGNKSVQDGSVLSFTLLATDADSDPLNFSSIALPSWLTLTDNLNGTATITGTASGVTTYTTTFIVSDDENAMDSEEITITVTAKPVEPVAPGGGGGGGGGGSGCTPNIQYSEWSECINGIQTRTYTVERRCFGDLEILPLEQACETPEETKIEPISLESGLKCDDGNPCTAGRLYNGECVFDAVNGINCYLNGKIGVCQNKECILPETPVIPEEKAPELNTPTGFFNLGEGAPGLIMFLLMLLGYMGYRVQGLKRRGLI